MKMKTTVLAWGFLAGALAAANVAEPPRTNAAQQELKEWFLENYYGRAPVGRPADMEFRGNEIWIAGGKVKIRLDVMLPPGASKERPCPVVLVADRRSCFPTPIDPGFLKSILAVQDEFRRMASERGYALVMWNVNDVAPDCWLYDRYVRAKPEQLPPNAWGVFGLYGGEPDGRKGDTWGTIRAWAWGHSRVMDWIESRPELDAGRVAVCGHSRLGKAALVAGVTDERFLVAYSNNSGVGGAHPHRLWKPGVCRLSFVNTRHLHWLCLNSRKFEADERNMPHDMDEFLALMAPRYLYVASASEDVWAGPEGEQFAAEMASRTWERMNLKGWGYRGHVGGHVRPGGHDFTPYDFKLFLDFCATPFGKAQWTCAGGNAGRAVPDGTWLRRDLRQCDDAFYLQTCNHPADTWGASGDTSVWRAFDAPEKGDYRLSFRYVGRPGMFGATTHVRVWKGVGTKGEKVLERTVRAMSDAAFVQYDAFVGIAEPGRYTVEFFQRQPEEMGARTDKTIVIDSVEFVRDRLFEQVKAERASALPAKYDVAALVYPGYQPDPRWPKELGIFREGIGEWQNIKEAKPKWPGHYQPRRPVWGFENEADPKVMERKIEAASSHGVNVFIYDWYWYYGRPFLEAGLHDGFLGARNNGKMQFFLMWANHNWTEGCNNKVSRRNDRLLWDVGAGLGPEGFRAMARRVIDMYFSRPNYYRICGRPVFMIYEMSTFVRCMGGMEAAAKALRLFREDCEAAGLGGVHLMGCSWGSFRPEHVAALGVESATMYTYAHHVTPKGAYLPWAANGLAKLDAEKARLRGLKAYFGHATVGWDTNPRYPEVMDTVVNSTPAEFEKALRDVKDWCDRNTPAGYPRLISINAWNEWIEGSYLEPDEKYGMGYLEAIHKVFR